MNDKGDDCVWVHCIGTTYYCKIHRHTKGDD